jgi:hypothetical protein
MDLGFDRIVEKLASRDRRGLMKPERQSDQRQQ